jgi:2-iminobutanoate/2-iminopropanoate deaminase
MDNRKFITTGKNIPKTSAPISQAVVAGNYCHISGQLAIDKNGNFVDGTIEVQTKMAFDNLFGVLSEAGFGIDEIVFVDIAFINLKDLVYVNPYFDALFEAGRKPARTIYQAAALPAGAKIKVLAIAIKT